MWRRPLLFRELGCQQSTRRKNFCFFLSEKKHEYEEFENRILNEEHLFETKRRKVLRRKSKTALELKEVWISTVIEEFWTLYNFGQNSLRYWGKSQIVEQRQQRSGVLRLPNKPRTFRSEDIIHAIWTNFAISLLWTSESEDKNGIWGRRHTLRERIELKFYL